MEGSTQQTRGTGLVLPTGVQQAVSLPKRRKPVFRGRLLWLVANRPNRWNSAPISLSRLWQQQGKGAKACQLLAEIYGWFIEGFDTGDLQEAKALLEEPS